MNVLLLGSGGREHALAWKLAQSQSLSKLWIAPGNAGTTDCGENINISVTDFDSIKQFVLDNQVNMVVVGPEDPLVKGIYDFFQQDESIRNIPVIGPSAKGAMLEGSKEFAKEFMKSCNIPTAAYQTFTKDNLAEGYTFLESLTAPYVLKADGLCGGKGVVILPTLEEAKQELSDMIADEKFGDASTSVVVEEFLSGIEVSFFVLTDGESYKMLPYAKDYKRIGEGDSGLNTGGMGAISPVPFVDQVFYDKAESQVIKPTIQGLKDQGIVYKGFIYFGLINVEGEPKVIEYNVRLGDPEAESIIPRVKSDLLELFEAVGQTKLSEKSCEIDEGFMATVILVSGGYPGNYPKGKEITGLDQASESIVFHAGTAIDERSGATVTNGGRVLAISSSADSMQAALAKSYETAKKIHFDGVYYRKDIGFDL